VAPSLKSRLARIRDSRGAEGVQASPTSRDGDIASTGLSTRRVPARRPTPAFLRGWRRLDDFLWARTLKYDIDLVADVTPETFAPLRRRRLSGAESPGARRSPEGRVPTEGLRFFDLETTGLSGGTGTVAFLAAVGRSRGGAFELEQLFLEDFPGERAFVLAVLGLLEGGVVASYNGRAFDLPLLRTRGVMNAVPVPRFEEIDVLFAARRLWKRVYGGASLELLEREVLGSERAEDIPGSMVPQVWLDFARSGESSLMPLVFAHNAEDVAALARLLSKVQSIFDSPAESGGRGDVDAAGLGRSLVAAGRGEEGEAILEAAAEGGDGAVALWLLRRYRIAGREGDCLRVEPFLPGGFKAAVERAKLYEHLVGDYATAMEWARRAAASASGDAEAEAAAKRAGRIARKLRKNARGGGGE